MTYDKYDKELLGELLRAYWCLFNNQALPTGDLFDFLDNNYSICVYSESIRVLYRLRRE